MARVLVERLHRPGTRDDGSTHRVQSQIVKSKPQKGEVHIVASVNIQPLEDKILVEANEAETRTASGIVIPDTAKEKPQEGTVIAVGPGRTTDKGKRIELDIEEGDVVIYSKYGGTEVKYGGKEYLLLSARDVLAKVVK